MQEVNRTSVIKRICLVNKSLVEVAGKAVICSTRDIARPAGEICFPAEAYGGGSNEEFQAAAAGVSGDGFVEPGLFTTAPSCSATACSAASSTASTKIAGARRQS